jgi:hypothetical protein
LSRIERTLFMLDWLEARNCAPAATDVDLRSGGVIVAPNPLTVWFYRKWSLGPGVAASMTRLKSPSASGTDGWTPRLQQPDSNHSGEIRGRFRYINAAE